MRYVSTGRVQIASLTILRAALNQAFRDGKVASDVPWRTVQPFREVDSPRLRYFTKDEVTRLINAAQGDFRDLVKAALFTGCRYGELGRLRAGDFNADSGTVFVGQSKSGKARHVVLTDEGRRFFEMLTVGRPGDALMLFHADGSAWGPSHQIRPMAEACSAARIEPGRWLPYFAAHRGVALGHERRAAERRGSQFGPCRHADDRAALQSLGAELCRRDDPQVCANVRDGGRDQYCFDRKEMNNGLR